MFCKLKLAGLFISALFIVQSTYAKSLCFGTFSDLTFNEEAGDLLGAEIRVANSISGKQATLQFSEGEPGPLVVVDVDCDGSNISFDIPTMKNGISGRFTGAVFKDRLVGQFFFGRGGRKDVILLRRRSYWD